MCAAEAAARPVSAAEAKRLFEPFTQASAIVLAVSGGPDSTALLLLASRWRAARKRKKTPKFLAATVDHGLRPQSISEAREVKRLARALGVPHRILRWRGRKPGAGLQQAARAARYRLLGDLARRAKANHIFTAHTLDDQAETVLMRMSRGSGISGLAAMRALSPLPVSISRKGHASIALARPLLGVPKARLLATLDCAGIAYAEDVSNRDPRFARARLREMMPALAREGLDAARLALLARRVARADNAIERAVDAAMVELSVRPAIERSQPKLARSKLEAVVLDAQRFFALPEEIALRLLGRAIAQVRKPVSIRLGKLETLYDALRASMTGSRHPNAHSSKREKECAPASHSSPAEDRCERFVRLRRTLAEALVTLSSSKLKVERAPPRSSGRGSPRSSLKPNGQSMRAKRADEANKAKPLPLA